MKKPQIGPKKKKPPTFQHLPLNRGMFSTEDLRLQCLISSNLSRGHNSKEAEEILG